MADGRRLQVTVTLADWTADASEATGVTGTRKKTRHLPARSGRKCMEMTDLAVGLNRKEKVVVESRKLLA